MAATRFDINDTVVNVEADLDVDSGMLVVELEVLKEGGITIQGRLEFAPKSLGERHELLSFDDLQIWLLEGGYIEVVQRRKTTLYKTEYKVIHPISGWWYEWDEEYFITKNTKEE